MSASTPLRPPPERKAVLREVLLASGGCTLLVAVLSWLQDYVPLLRANLYVVVAGLFLYLPVWLLRRRGLGTLDVGLSTRPRRRNLAFALGAMLVTFPPFLLGFHAWQAWRFDHGPRFEQDAYLRWPAAWEGRPAAKVQAPGLDLWVDFQDLYLRYSGLGPEPVRLALRSDGALRLLHQRGARVLERGEHDLDLELHQRGTLRFRVEGGRDFRLEATRAGQALPAGWLRLGAGSEEASALPLEGRRSATWILYLVLSHLLLVALPEELFYRGYVQTSLDGVWAPRWRLLGVRVGPSLLVTSLIFALGHYLVDFRVQRLAVFFPSLLFGWMRAGTGSLAAPILYHAASNVLSDLLTKGYVP